MHLVLATSNRGKFREIKRYFGDIDVVAYTDIIEAFEIEENSDTFAGNALIKARAVYDALNDENVVVLSDDSGISLPLLGNEPGIYSARYAGVGSSDRDNLLKLRDSVVLKGVDSTKAFYTAAIALVSNRGAQIVHGWMHGNVITQMRGENGFGYDPIFIPDGYSQTLGELGDEVKEKISHRVQALELAHILLNGLK